jgi:ATP-dependent DNA ligase
MFSTAEIYCHGPDPVGEGQGFEGIVAKRIGSRYEPGQRSGAWQKMRVNQGQEFVIGGYTPAGRNFDAIIFGYYENEGRLILCRPHPERLHAGFRGRAVPEVPRPGDG